MRQWGLTYRYIHTCRPTSTHCKIFHKQHISSTTFMVGLLRVAGQFVRFWASEGAKFPKMGDSLPKTPMNHRAKFDTGREIRNHTNTQNYKQTVTDITAPCLSACVDKKGKGFPYSLPSVGPRTDSGVQAVSLQVTMSHPPGDRLWWLSTRPAVTFPAAEHHRPLAGIKLYFLVKEAHRCEQLSQGCYAAMTHSK